MSVPKGRQGFRQLADIGLSNRESADEYHASVDLTGEGPAHEEVWNCALREECHDRRIKMFVEEKGQHSENSSWLSRSTGLGGGAGASHPP